MGGCAPKMYIQPACLPLSHGGEKKRSFWHAGGILITVAFAPSPKEERREKGWQRKGGKGALKVGAREERAFHDESPITISPLFIGRVLSLLVGVRIFSSQFQQKAIAVFGHFSPPEKFLGVH